MLDDFFDNSCYDWCGFDFFSNNICKYTNKYSTAHRLHLIVLKTFIVVSEFLVIFDQDDYIYSKKNLITNLFGYDLSKADRTHKNTPLIHKLKITDFDNDFKPNIPSISQRRQSKIIRRLYRNNDYKFKYLWKRTCEPKINLLRKYRS